MGCNGVCHRWKAKNTGGKYLRYINGNVRCQVCEIFLTSEGVLVKVHGKYCRCCYNRIRSKPRCTSCKKAYETLPTITITKWSSSIHSELERLPNKIYQRKVADLGVEYVNFNWSLSKIIKWFVRIVDTLNSFSDRLEFLK